MGSFSRFQILAPKTGQYSEPRRESSPQNSGIECHFPPRLLASGLGAIGSVSKP